jgi:RNA polymerase sigma factor (sigma-70 family)
MELSDAQLVQRCRDGDAAAWAVLVERFSRYVYAVVGQAFRLRDDDAEDVFQDVFTKVYERLDGLRDVDAFRPWLARITRNACIDKLRTTQREESSADEVEPPGVDESLAQLDEAIAVRDALARLSPDCREILDRFFARDESYLTIGEALGLASGTIASRISRCLAHLRDEYTGKKSGRGSVLEKT